MATTTRATKDTPARRLAALVLPIMGGFNPPGLHWISGGKDEATPYCYECAEKEVARILKKNPKADVHVAGGYGTEEDGPRFCETCGRLLDCTFTDYGVESELEHFAEPDSPIDGPEAAWCVLTMLGYWGNPMLGEKCGDWHYMPEANPIIEAIIGRLEAKAD